ncbi:antibiotic biosynthesis monooxygenase [Tistrella mobilis]|uniref:Antibiotic biosynthesis monooxygenase n=1 Tax=Tistrella mobilis TaxID=171437 RepID=A0A162KG01_9PROT|nr:antibiotic biosynthesis monooxygenase [Tistrella mobilis]KYO51186.1 antibiotic biosynthesis monooxygenase [Tistrella mobilis]
MILVVFEAVPTEIGRQTYLEHATMLSPRLGEVDGFVSVERYENLARPGHLLSLSAWRDMAAVDAWRRDGAHRMAQAVGRSGVFADYRLRVATTLRDYGLTQRAEAPADAL